MEVIKHGRYIRVEISENFKDPTNSDIEKAIQDIIISLNNVTWIGERHDTESYMVDGKEYYDKFEAIMAETKFKDKFENEYDTFCLSENSDIVLSLLTKKDDSISNNFKNITAKKAVIEIFYHPYIHKIQYASYAVEKALYKFSEEMI